MLDPKTIMKEVRHGMFDAVFNHTEYEASPLRIAVFCDTEYWVCIQSRMPYMCSEHVFRKHRIDSPSLSPPSSHEIERDSRDSLYQCNSCDGFRN